jgi:hypothetical protein
VIALWVVPLASWLFSLDSEIFAAARAGVGCTCAGRWASVAHAKAARLAAIFGVPLFASRTWIDVMNEF